MSQPIQNQAIAQLINSRSAIKPPTTPLAGNIGSVSPAQDFAALLQDRLKISGHANARLQSRNIQLGKDEWNRVMTGVDKVAAKGAKESLVLVDNVALLVSVKNRTVITAVDQSSLKDNVFTNIDSAVIV